MSGTDRVARCYIYFQTKNPKLGQIGPNLFGLRMENFGMFYGYLESTKAIWYISWPFGDLLVIWYLFPQFW
jgi:hypothetical protein